MSLETRKADAQRVLNRWERSNKSAVVQDRLIADNVRLWRMARDLARALDSLLAKSHAHSSGRVLSPHVSETDD